MKIIERHDNIDFIRSYFTPYNVGKIHIPFEMEEVQILSLIDMGISFHTHKIINISYFKMQKVEKM